MTGHGSHFGLNWHTATGTPNCRECREFKRLYARRRRFGKGEQRDPTRCDRCGSVFPEHACGMGGAP